MQYRRRSLAITLPIPSLAAFSLVSFISLASIAPGPAFAGVQPPPPKPAIATQALPGLTKAELDRPHEHAGLPKQK